MAEKIDNPRYVAWLKTNPAQEKPYEYPFFINDMHKKFIVAHPDKCMAYSGEICDHDAFTKFIEEEVDRMNKERFNKCLIDLI